MAEANMLPFLQTFTRCAFSREAQQALQDCRVAVEIEKASRTMRLKLDSSAPLAESVLSCVRTELTGPLG